jgi:aminodeoxyfutalosine deaminase
MKFRYSELLPRAIDRAHATERLHIGLSPHSPYTIDLPSFVECLKTAREMKLRLATHLAELPYEQEFLTQQSGPLRELYERLGKWEDPVETFNGSSLRFAHAIGLLDYPTLLAHVNYCTDQELDLLARGNASVVYCPRTHRYFGHPPHRFREILQRGINVALGTDSCASSPDLNLLDDLRLVHETAPEIPTEKLFELVTVNAARALELEDQVGSLESGKRADFAVFPAGSGRLLDLLESRVLPRQTWIAGRRVQSI